MKDEEWYFRKMTQQEAHINLYVQQKKAAVVELRLSNLLPADVLLSIVGGRCANGLFQGCNTLQCLGNTIHTQSDHIAFLHCGTLNHVTGRTLDNQVTDGFVRHQEFVNTGTALVTGTVALFTAAA